MATVGRTWIVVLDDSRVRFFRRERSGTLIEAAPEINGDMHGGGAAMPDARRKNRDVVLRNAVATLDQASKGTGCDQILLIAPERVLSTFRKLASDRVRARLWRERASEVASLSSEEIAEVAKPYFGSPVD